MVLATPPHIRQQDRTRMNRHFFRCFQRNHDNAIGIAPYNIAGAHLNAAASDFSLKIRNFTAAGNNRASTPFQAEGRSLSLQFRRS